MKTFLRLFVLFLAIAANTNLTAMLTPNNSSNTQQVEPEKQPQQLTNLVGALGRTKSSATLSPVSPAQDLSHSTEGDTSKKSILDKHKKTPLTRTASSPAISSRPKTENAQNPSKLSPNELWKIEIFDSESGNSKKIRCISQANSSKYILEDHVDQNNLLTFNRDSNKIAFLNSKKDCIVYDLSTTPAKRVVECKDKLIKDGIIKEIAFSTEDNSLVILSAPKGKEQSTTKVLRIIDSNNITEVKLANFIKANEQQGSIEYKLSNTGRFLLKKDKGNFSALSSEASRRRTVTVIDLENPSASLKLDNQYGDKFFGEKTYFDDNDTTFICQHTRNVIRKYSIQNGRLTEIPTVYTTRHVNSDLNKKETSSDTNDASNPIQSIKYENDQIVINFYDQDKQVIDTVNGQDKLENQDCQEILSGGKSSDESGLTSSSSQNSTLTQNSTDNSQEELFPAAIECTNTHTNPIDQEISPATQKDNFHTLSTHLEELPADSQQPEEPQPFHFVNSAASDMLPQDQNLADDELSQQLSTPTKKATLPYRSKSAPTLPAPPHSKHWPDESQQFASQFIKTQKSDNAQTLNLQNSDSRRPNPTQLNANTSNGQTISGENTIQSQDLFAVTTATPSTINEGFASIQAKDLCLFLYKQNIPTDPYREQADDTQDNPKPLSFGQNTHDTETEPKSSPLPESKSFWANWATKKTMFGGLALAATIAVCWWWHKHGTVPPALSQMLGKMPYLKDILIKRGGVKLASTPLPPLAEIVPGPSPAPALNGLLIAPVKETVAQIPSQATSAVASSLPQMPNVEKIAQGGYAGTPANRSLNVLGNYYWFR